MRTVAHLPPHLAEGLELVDELVHEVERPALGDHKVGVAAIEERVEQPAVVLPRRQVVLPLGLSNDRGVLIEIRPCRTPL